MVTGALSIGSKIIKKPKKLVGYVLLLIGIVVSIPIFFSLSILFTGSSAIPKILETPEVSFGNLEVPVGDGTVIIRISYESINEVMGKFFPAANLYLFFVISIVLVSAASVLMGKGVRLIKEVKLKVVAKEVSEEIAVEKIAKSA